MNNVPRRDLNLGRLVQRVAGLKEDGRRIFFSLGLGVAVVGATALAMAVGVAPQAWAQVLYIPILLSAAGLGALGAIGVALASALVLMPGAISVGASIPGWQAQIAFLAAFTIVVGWLFRASARGRDSAYTQDFALAHDRILVSLANTVEVRDHHTQGHCQRVAQNAVVMGSALGFTREELEVLYWSAMLHDLGKIAVPEYILQKHGPLTEDEFAEIRRHPSYGADLLASIAPEFRPMAEIVRAHHERWDGQGYPLGCHGDEIPLMARVIAVVDVFEALTSERPYRSPMAPEKALHYLRRGSGSQFDPSLVPLFEALYEREEIRTADAAPERHTVLGAVAEHRFQYST